jgi:hypothetical protein
MLKKKIWANFQRKNILTKTLSLSSQKYGFGIRNPGSEIRDPEKPHPDAGSGSATLLRNMQNGALCAPPSNEASLLLTTSQSLNTTMRLEHSIILLS